MKRSCMLARGTSRVFSVGLVRHGLKKTRARIEGCLFLAILFFKRRGSSTLNRRKLY